jgi:hypothetical protein
MLNLSTTLRSANHKVFPVISRETAAAPTFPLVTPMIGEPSAVTERRDTCAVPKSTAIPAGQNQSIWRYSLLTGSPELPLGL